MDKTFDKLYSLAEDLEGMSDKIGVGSNLFMFFLVQKIAKFWNDIYQLEYITQSDSEEKNLHVLTQWLFADERIHFDIISSKNFRITPTYKTGRSGMKNFTYTINAHEQKDISWTGKDEKVFAKIENTIKNSYLKNDIKTYFNNLNVKPITQKDFWVRRVMWSFFSALQATRKLLISRLNPRNSHCTCIPHEHSVKEMLIETTCEIIVGHIEIIRAELDLVIAMGSPAYLEFSREFARISFEGSKDAMTFNESITALWYPIKDIGYFFAATSMMKENGQESHFPGYRISHHSIGKKQHEQLLKIWENNTYAFTESLVVQESECFSTIRNSPYLSKPLKASFKVNKTQVLQEQANIIKNKLNADYKQFDTPAYIALRKNKKNIEELEKLIGIKIPKNHKDSIKRIKDSQKKPFVKKSEGWKHVCAEGNTISIWGTEQGKTLLSEIYDWVFKINYPCFGMHSKKTLTYECKLL